MKTTWTEIEAELQPGQELPTGTLNASMRHALRRLQDHDGAGFVSHSTALALQRRGLVKLAAGSAAPPCSWVMQGYHAVLTAKGAALARKGAATDAV